MKLIIDIDENYIKDFKLQADLIGKDLMESPSGMAKYAIANGTPLQEELEEIKEKILWETNGQYFARIGASRVLDIIDKRIKEIDNE